MKRKFLFFLLALTIVVGPALFFGCSIAKEIKDLAEDVFYEAVKAVAPTFTEASSSGVSSRATTTWEWGDPVYELYGILVDIESGWDGYFNIYDVMRGADQYFTQLDESGTVITAQPVNASVDVGFNGLTEKITYDQVLESTDADSQAGYKYKTFGRIDDSGIVYMLHTNDITLDDEKNKSVVQGWYDQATMDMAIGMFFANYLDPATIQPGETAGWEIVKAYVSGNTETHIFKLKVIRDGTGYDHNIVGYGVSEGAGDYFLMKIANDSLPFTNTKYYEFAADATLEELQAMDAAGSDTVPANTADYEDDLPTNYPADELLSQADVEALDVTAVTYTE